MIATLRSRAALAAVAATLATALAVATGILGWRWATLGLVVVAALAELPAAAGGTPIDAVLQRASLERLPRSIIRMFAVLAAGFSTWQASGMLPAFGWTAALLIAAAAAVVLLRAYVVHARTPVVLTRNVELSVPDLHPSPPPLTDRGVATLGALELGIVLPALVAPGSPALLWVVGLVCVAVLLALAGWLALSARAVGGSLRGPAFRKRVQAFLDSCAPEVMVYFGGRRESSYQLTMWLSTLERLPQRTVIVLRDPKVFAALPATSLPVLCVPGAVDLMSLDFSSAHVALFTANVGNSLHVLRLPHLMTAFIGHGDSDKSASSSPFAKVYDEIWVAGPAGRDRYRRAQVGVRDEDVVEVGRPQLDGLLAGTGPRPPGVPTLLYAPTWEGWNAEQHYTSLDSLGPELIAAALAGPDPVRVLYKPHPFTGRRDPRIARAHSRIVAMLGAANAGGTGEPACAALSVELPPPAVSEGFAGAFSRSEWSAVQTEAARSRAEAAFWSARDPASHLVVSADGPSLFSCFQVADALVTDVSSVLTDFAVTGRPYAVTNPTAIPRADFTAMFPAAAAGFVVDPGEGIAGLLEVIAGRAPDLQVAERARQRAELLGSQAVPSMTLFADAVESLAARGRAREAAHLERGVLPSGGFSTSDAAGEDD